MKTIGYLLILIGILLFREATNGRSLGDVPGDLGDAFAAAVTGDVSRASAALSRKSGTTASVDPQPPPGTYEGEGNAIPQGYTST